MKDYKPQVGDLIIMKSDDPRRRYTLEPKKFKGYTAYDLCWVIKTDVSYRPGHFIVKVIDSTVINIDSSFDIGFSNDDREFNINFIMRSDDYIDIQLIENAPWVCEGYIK